MIAAPTRLQSLRTARHAAPAQDWKTAKIPHAHCTTQALNQHQ